MEFRKFRAIMQKSVADLLTDQRQLYTADVNRDRLWDLYLDSFPEGTNELFRERREMDCSCCRAFVKQFGGVVAIKDNKPVSIWRFETNDAKFQPVISALAALVESAPVKDAFVTRQSAYGTDYNHEQLSDGQVHTWNHFRVELPAAFVTGLHKSEAALRGELRASREVFQRSLEEISRPAIETVLDLIAEKSLYRGEEWQAVLEQFLALHKEYHALFHSHQNNYCWAKSVEIGGAISRIKNHSVGVLLQDITDGAEVTDAVRKYETIVAPTNYQRPKAIFTKQMVEQAQATVERLGLLESLGRRHAKLDDITVNNVLWANKDAARCMDGAGGVFDALKQEVAVKPRQFDRLPGVAIEWFIQEILPAASSLEVLFENRHTASLMSLIAPMDASAPTLFKWPNGFSWAYNGNIADSMKARVKAAGGDVTGVLRFSIQWNENNDNKNDFDAHCVESNKNRIHYPSAGRRHLSSGVLDVDIIHPVGVAVENITWSDLRKMPQGEYKLMVHNYSHRGGRSGFAAEVECDGEIHEYEYSQDFAQNEFVQVARVELGRDGFKIVDVLPSTTSTKTVWGLTTNQFHRVSVVTHSPNYWDGHGVGNRHYLFMLAGCENPDRPNGFFNEYLRQDLIEHKRVFEALGGKMRVGQADEQLSGVGFSSTQRNSLIVKVDGKAVKIVF